MRVIYAGLSCFLLASVVACGGQSADENTTTDAGGADGGAHGGDKTNKPDKGKGGEDAGQDDRDEEPTDDTLDPGTNTASGPDSGPAPTITGTGTPTGPSGTGGAPNVRDDSSSGGTGDNTEPNGVGGDSGIGSTDMTEPAPTSSDSTDDEPTDSDAPDTDDTESDPTSSDTDDTTDSDPETDDTGTDDTVTDDTETDDTSAGGAGPGPTVRPPVIIPPKLNEPTIPEGCVASSNNSGQDYCGASFECDGMYYSSSCSDLGDTASCYCSGGGNDMNYVVTGLDDQDLCKAPLEWCRSGALKAEGPQTCETDPISYPKDTCYSARPCTQLLDLGNGITIEKTISTSSTSMYCNKNGSEWSCSCSQGNYYSDYRLNGATQETACTELAPICFEGEKPTYGEPDCTDNSPGDESYCSRSCTEEAVLGGDVTLSRNTYTEANCYEVDGGRQCSCYSPQYFTFTTQASAEDACDQTGDICTSNLNDVEWGNVGDECEVTSTSISGGSCYATVQCNWDVTLAEIPVSVTGEASMYCSPSDDGETWACTCNNSGKSFTFPIGDSTFESCSDAGINCAEDAVPGGNGGIIFEEGVSATSVSATGAPATSASAIAD